MNAKSIPILNGSRKGIISFKLKFNKNFLNISSIQIERNPIIQ